MLMERPIIRLICIDIENNSCYSTIAIVIPRAMQTPVVFKLNPFIHCAIKMYAPCNGIMISKKERTIPYANNIWFQVYFSYTLANMKRLFPYSYIVAYY